MGLVCQLCNFGPDHLHRAISKPADAVVDSGLRLPFPTRTNLLHHEVEMVVAVNDEVRQAGDLKDMIWSVADIAGQACCERLPWPALRFHLRENNDGERIDEGRPNWRAGTDAVCGAGRMGSGWLSTAPREILLHTPLIDGHNDLPWEIRDRFKSDLRPST